MAPEREEVERMKLKAGTVKPETAGKEDVRVIKTKRSIVDALMALLEKKTWDKITIKDICEQAMISRSTFYTHFADKYELLEYLISGEGFSVTWEEGEKTIRERFNEQLTRIKGSEKALKNLFTSRPEEEIVALFSRQFQEMAKRILMERGVMDYISEDGLNIAVGFYAAGFSHAVAIWIIRMPELSVEEMTENLYWLAVPQIRMLDYMMVKGKKDTLDAFDEWLGRNL